ncbi:hypothetical protein GALL_481930 [mine drainage metagenome]|uniref:Uncharacterized protein n=1 Tax=mine drainage metagenome TaxID=410659 RepID=A0A1J5PY54_9ZZZZ
MFYVPRREMRGERKGIGSRPDDRDGDPTHDGSFVSTFGVLGETRGVERKNRGKDLMPR